MLKRTLAGILWFFAAWSVWTIVAYPIGLPGILGVVIGAAAAGFVVVDPKQRIWRRPAPEAASAVASTASPAV